MRNAFTILEMIVVVAVIAVLTSILAPAFSAARHSAHVRSSIGNLRQFHLATKMYQMDHDGDGLYGDLPVMGLPDSIFVINNGFKLPYEMEASPCGVNPSWFDGGKIVFQYEYRPGLGGTEFTKLSELYKENLLLFTDLNCADHGAPLYDPFISHHGLGVLLSGELINRNKPGRVDLPSWWSRPQE